MRLIVAFMQWRVIDASWKVQAAIMGFEVLPWIMYATHPLLGWEMSYDNGVLLLQCPARRPALRNEVLVSSCMWQRAALPPCMQPGTSGCVESPSSGGPRL